MQRIVTIWELISSGARRGEAVHLASLAHRLGALPVPHLGARRAERIAARVGFGYREPLVSAPVGAAAAAFAVFALAITLAQGAGPGSPLYTLRRGTDFVQSVVHPEPSATPQPPTPGTKSSASPSTIATPVTSGRRPAAAPTATSGAHKPEDSPESSPGISPTPTTTGGDDHGGKGKVQGTATASPTPTATSNPNSGGKNKP